MDIKAVVFDFGKVLSLPPEEDTLQTMATIAGADAADLGRLFWGRRGLYDRGTQTGAEYYAGILAELGLRSDDQTVNDLIAVDLESWARLDPEAVRLAEDARRAGFKLGILSNMPRDFLRIVRDRFPLLTGADAQIYSCELGSIKPEAPIYQALLAALGMNAAEVVFFDDLPVNVEAALALGFRAFVWRDAATARLDLAGLGVRL